MFLLLRFPTFTFQYEIRTHCKFPERGILSFVNPIMREVYEVATQRKTLPKFGLTTKMNSTRLIFMNLRCCIKLKVTRATGRSS